MGASRLGDVPGAAVIRRELIDALLFLFASVVVSGVVVAALRSAGLV